MRTKKNTSNIIRRGASRAEAAKRGIISFAACLALAAALSPAASATGAETRLIPLGGTVGISLSSEGVIVVGIQEKTKDGTAESPAKAAGIKTGDIVKYIGPMQIEAKDDLKEILSRLDGSPVPVEVLRDGQPLTMSLTPHRHEDGAYELGLWLRDGIAGIGTLTFYDPKSGLFGALGHSINDAESGTPVPLKNGVIVRSSVTGVTKGKAGTPGQLNGSFDFDDVLGSVTANTGSGIFGYMNENIAESRGPLPVASVGEIRTGPATILANVSGGDVKEYGIEISRVYSGAEGTDRSMMITVTDQRLIGKTSGIVQGMSGSPIIQNGKLVGAVTHVLINDPERGYGISAERMLQTALENTRKNAA